MLLALLEDGRSGQSLREAYSKWLGCPATTSLLYCTFKSHNQARKKAVTDWADSLVADLHYSNVSACMRPTFWNISPPTRITKEKGEMSEHGRAVYTYQIVLSNYRTHHFFLTRIKLTILF